MAWTATDSDTCRPGEAERLQEGEVTTSPAHRRDEGQPERDHRPQRQACRHQGGRGPHGAVVHDLSGKQIRLNQDRVAGTVTVGGVRKCLIARHDDPLDVGLAGSVAQATSHADEDKLRTVEGAIRTAVRQGLLERRRDHAVWKEGPVPIEV